MEKKIKHHFVRDGANCLPFLMTSNTLTSLNYNQVSCLPGIIAPVERGFSKINDAWTASNRFTISIIKSVHIVRTNVNNSCQEFTEKLAKHRTILRKIHSSEKYVD